MKDFNSWNAIKQKLDKSAKSLSLKEGDIWWCSIGQNIGSEVYGKGQYFRRPVIIFKKISSNLCIIIPLTTKGHEGSWYISIRSGSRLAWTMIHQIRLISTSRLNTKIGAITQESFYKIKESLADLLGFFSLSPEVNPDHRVSPNITELYPSATLCQICYNTPMNPQTHTSLYRKYRPSSFEEVTGQDHVVKVLQSAITNSKPHHAYLFTGSRGIGKTSIARIFAKALGVEVEDIYEIDAASYTGVDNIRSLTESAMTLPFRSPYKIYILDEVHMLSKAAFNAFLKGLEEPPKHVIYILATTELGKLPETILSRCEVHTFRTPSVDILTGTVESVAKKEGYTVSPEAAKIIALSGDESFRDTLGVLQKVIDGTKGKKIEVGDVEELIGVPKIDLIDRLVDNALKSQDVASTIDDLRKANSDSKIIYDLYLEKLRERLRNPKITAEERDRVLVLLTKALEEYRHLRFVDPMMMLEVVTG